VEATDSLYVADGTLAELRVYTWTPLALSGKIKLSEDVGHGGDAANPAKIAVVDTEHVTLVANIPVATHSEALEIDPKSRRAFANIADSNEFAVIATGSKEITAHRKLTKAADNVPLAFDSEHQLLYVACRTPGTLIALADGKTIMANWVISAADGHSTIFDLLGGKYVDTAIEKVYDERGLFPSYLQVSLGVALDLSEQPRMATRLLSSPLIVDPETELDHLGFRFFNFDPTFAPPGKTAVTCFLPTRNFTYWENLRRNYPVGYQEKKHRVAEAVIDILEKRIPGVRTAIEVVDVSTPATVIRYTGNWKGSMEGWLIAPGASFKPLPNTLAGLHGFLMVGQWVMPGGGLPSGIMTARTALKAICKHDRVPFDLHAREAVKPEPVAV